ncbi:MAG: hypothetical protein AB7P76_09745 [Candidatus Melainabacteria bacterium]
MVAVMAFSLSLPALTLSLTVQAESAVGALKGAVIQSDVRNDSPTVNEDDIKEVTPGTTLDMVVSTALSTDVTAKGDEFFSKVTKDYMVDGKVVIPRGTLVHGIVENKADPKWAGRKAWMATRFDYMITPDGREVPIEGNNSTRDNKLTAAAKVVGRASGYTLTGGVVGALMVLKVGGIPLVAATEGYALAGGAAVGGAVGLTAAMIKKGAHAMIQPGTEIRVSLSEPLELPTMNMPAADADNFNLDGLDVKVLGSRVDRDPFGELNELTLTIDVSNATENVFTSFDIGLEDEYGNLFYPSPFGDSGLWFHKLMPNSKMHGNVSFNVDDPKRQHYLVFFKQYTREKLAKIAITDSMQVDKKTQKQLAKKS